MDKKTKQAVIATAAAFLLLTAVFIIIIIQKNTPSEERVALTDYYDLAEGEAAVILQQERYEKNARVVDGTVYLDLETVQGQLNKELYYDAAEEVLTLTTPNEIIRAYPGKAEYYSNKTKLSLAAPAVIKLEKEVYLSVAFIEEYSDFHYAYYENPNRLLLWNEWKDLLCFEAKKATALREGASIKSGILADIPKGEKLWYIDANGEEGRKFVKVMTDTGLFGYIRKRDLTDSYYVSVESTYTEPVYTHITRKEKIVLGWHQVTNQEANRYLDSVVAENEALTVISPTWFRITDEEGTISSLASAEYVTRAHELGLEVWGLVDNFDPLVSSYAVLSSTERRERLENALIAEAIKYDLDGINIDFETLTLETGVHYVQFLKELSVKCRMNGIILSVDNYVPSAHAAYYDLASQGKVVDYVIIMAYDEHYSGSAEAGSVASIGFLEKAIADTCAVVPANQIIMGVPFYTRLWQEKTENGVTTLSSEALTMLAAETELLKNGVLAEWDEETKQYYAEYEKNAVRFQIWLEEETSLREKLSRIAAADLAGVAAWRLGFEKEEVWPLFTEFFAK